MYRARAGLCVASREGPTCRESIFLVTLAPRRCCVLSMTLGSPPAMPKLVLSIHCPQQPGSMRQLTACIELGKDLYRLDQQVARLLIGDPVPRMPRPGRSASAPTRSGCPGRSTGSRLASSVSHCFVQLTGRQCDLAKNALRAGLVQRRLGLTRQRQGRTPPLHAPRPSPQRPGTPTPGSDEFGQLAVCAEPLRAPQQLRSDTPAPRPVSPLANSAAPKFVRTIALITRPPLAVQTCRLYK